MSESGKIAFDIQYNLQTVRSQSASSRFSLLFGPPVVWTSHCLPFVVIIALLDLPFVVMIPLVPIIPFVGMIALLGQSLGLPMRLLVARMMLKIPLPDIPF